MKYDLSKIMKDAHALRKEGYSMSTALKVAWCIAKIDAIKESDEYFRLQMRDSFTPEQRELDIQYSRQINEFVCRAYNLKEAETHYELDQDGEIANVVIRAA